MLDALPKKEIEEIVEEDQLPVDTHGRVICKHCGKHIDIVKLLGLSLICPRCGKPQNGKMRSDA